MGVGIFVSSSECPFFCAGHRSVIGCIFVISYRDNSGRKTKNYASCWRILYEYNIVIHSVLTQKYINSWFNRKGLIASRVL